MIEPDETKFYLQNQKGSYINKNFKRNGFKVILSVQLGLETIY